MTPKVVFLFVYLFVFSSHFTECDAGFPVTFCSEYELPVQCRVPSLPPKNVDRRRNSTVGARGKKMARVWS